MDENQCRMIEIANLRNAIIQAEGRIITDAGFIIEKAHELAWALYKENDNGK